MSTSQEWNKNSGLETYGTPGNQFKNMMVGGKDVIAINKMLQEAFESGKAGVGEATVKIGEYVKINDNYKGRAVFEQKAADKITISLDDEGEAYVKLIVRKGDPGKDLVALAGGFKDEGETDAESADREDKEEAKSKAGTVIAEYEIPRHPVKGDVRVWSAAERPDGVKEGDIITMSTMAVVAVVENIHDNKVEAGDDASNAGWVKFSDIEDANIFGIKDHAAMLLEAARLAGISNQLPESFESSLAVRKNDIAVATEGVQLTAAVNLLQNNM